MGDGRRGRLISASDRKKAVELINEAVSCGATLYKACRELRISKRSYNRWRNTNSDYIDKRMICERPTPANKLSQEERQEILRVVDSEEFASKSPSEIVPILADRGMYIGSESTFYKVLREAEELTHRGRSKAPVSRPISTHVAMEANQVWMWDITYYQDISKGNQDTKRTQEFLKNNPYEDVEKAVFGRIEFKDANSDGKKDLNDLKQDESYKETYDFLNKLKQSQ